MYRQRTAGYCLPPLSGSDHNRRHPQKDRLTKPTLRLFAGLEYNGAGGISEQDRACPFHRIDTAAQYIGGNDEHGAAVGADKAIGKGERIKKAGTGPSEIDRAGSDEAQPVCEQRRRGGRR